MFLRPFISSILLTTCILSSVQAAQTCITTAIPVNNQDVNAISGTSNYVIAVADNANGNGQISILVNGVWVAQTDPNIPNKDFNDIFVFGVNSAIAVGDDGAVVILRPGPPSGWLDVSISNQDYTTIWADGTNNVFIAGDNGRIFYWDGTYSGTTPNWTSIGTNNNNDDFVDSWGDATYVYFLDSDGEVFRYQRSTLTAQISEKISPNCAGNIDFNGFTSDGAGNFYLFGENRSPNPDQGVIFKWNGVTAWTTNTCSNVFQTASSDDINAVNINPNGTFTAVGDNGVVVTSADGTTWTEISSGGQDINAAYTLTNGSTIYGADNGANQICTENKPHFSIVHDGFASTCAAEAVKIRFHDLSHAIGTNYTGTINLSTSSGKGTWGLLTGANSGSFADSGTGNGTASYTFVAADSDEIILTLANTTAETLNINVSDGTYTEFLTEDNNLTFSGGAATTTFADDFSTNTFSNSTGATTWVPIWTESGEADGPGAGDLRVTSTYFRLEGNDDAGGDANIKSLSRSVNLTALGATAATLQFKYQRQSLEQGNDRVFVETSTDGINWTELARFQGSGNPRNDTSFVTSPSYNLTVSATTQIRFRNDTGMDANDFVYFDDVIITATGIPSPCSTIDHIRIEHDGEGLTCDKERVTVKACVDANCTSEYTAGNVTATLTPDGDTVTFTGNTTAYVRQSTIGSATLGATVSSLPAPINSTARCFNGATETCSMNFVDTGFRFTDGANPPNPITIGTQIGGKPSNIQPGMQTIALQAVRKDNNTGACVGVFADNTDVSIEMASQCNNPSTCITTNKVRVTDNSTPTAVITSINNNPNTAVTSYSSVPLHFTTNSQAILSFVYPDVGQISLHARYNIPDSTSAPTGNYMSGNSNNFVVRPFAFYINVASNPAASGPLGNIFTAAGVNFTSTVTAKLWEAADDDPLPANYDGIANGHNDTDPTNNVDLSLNANADNYGKEVAPNNAPNSTIEQVLLSSVLNQPSPGGNDPGLTGGTTINSFTNGGGTTSTLRYDEVGIIEINATVSDGDYLGIGAAETAKIVGRSGYVGRFTPAYFDVVATEGCSVGTTNFTYSNQGFTVNVTAKSNVGGITTKNYDGGFVKAPEISNAGITTNFTNNTLDQTHFTDGIGTRNDVTYTFVNKNTSPLSMTNIRAVDSDTISSNTHAEGSNLFRSGRLVINNAYGSEFNDLKIPMTAEYYDGNSFIINTDDACLSGVTLSLLNSTDSLTVGNGTSRSQTCIWDNGSVAGNLSGSNGCDAIGLASEQYIGKPIAGAYSLYLKQPDTTAWTIPANPIFGNVTIQSNNVPSYLQYDWDNNGTHDNSPTGIGTFGIYRGDDRIIYWREVFK